MSKATRLDQAIVLLDETYDFLGENLEDMKNAEVGENEPIVVKCRNLRQEIHEWLRDVKKRPQ